MASLPKHIPQLNEKHEQFGAEYLDTGSAAEAARRVGYSPSYGRQLKMRDDIRAAILIASRKEFEAGAAPAVRTIIDLAQHGRSEKVRLDAAKYLADRVFGRPTARVQTTIPVAELGIDEIRQEIRELAEELGLTDMIDVTPDRTPTNVVSKEDGAEIGT
ncbi:MAG: hypothetical protein GY791_12910 [Alphaproteobacteria bacterium]|nr:hypothetical protein [Alphaproteobacteria bacterium]